MSFEYYNQQVLLTGFSFDNFLCLQLFNFRKYGLGVFFLLFFFFSFFSFCLFCNEGIKAQPARSTANDLYSGEKKEMKDLSALVPTNFKVSWFVFLRFLKLDIHFWRFSFRIQIKHSNPGVHFLKTSVIAAYKALTNACYFKSSFRDRMGFVHKSGIFNKEDVNFTIALMYSVFTAAGCKKCK